MTKINEKALGLVLQKGGLEALSQSIVLEH